MENCGNMDQYSFEYKPSYLQIEKFANLSSKSGDKYQLILQTPEHLVIIDKSVVEILSKENFVKISPRNCVTL